MNRSYRNLAVFDVGKTNIKFSLLDASGQVLSSNTAPNHGLNAAPYPHYDTEYLWSWLLEQLAATASDQPQAIIVVAHGATAALMTGDDLALPILDYEFSQPETLPSPRPDFDQTASPSLPKGLNLGRQIYWQQQQFPAEFARVDKILMYPQYWAFRLCGVAATEVTSLGAHTDLWNPYQHQFSSLVEQNWSGLFPAIQPAWAVLGELKSEIQQQVNFTQPCDVLCGVHDSNASLVPYLQSPSPQPSPRYAAKEAYPTGGREGLNPTVVSTGTWVISMVAGGHCQLYEERDMLANVNVLGQPVPTARYMGGREFEAILEAPIPQNFDWAWIEQVIHESLYALPSFSDNGGAFTHMRGQFVPHRPDQTELRYALASLYSVLMVDLQLDWLESRQAIYLEGSFGKNPFIPALLAALRPQQTVFASSEASGTTLGAFYLAHWHEPKPALARQAVQAAPVNGLIPYRQTWRSKVAALR